MTQISVVGANGTPIIFTVTPTSATNMAVAFANTVNGLYDKHELKINVLSNNGTASLSPTKSAPVLNEILSAGAYLLSKGGEYTFVDTTPSANTNASADTTAASGDVIVTGSAAGADTVEAATNTTYLAVGSDNVVSFVAGNDVYQGSTIPGATGDTVTAGSGADTINTNSGNTTVFGGGSGMIVLNDTTTGSSGYNDVAFLGDGTNTVLASGVDDVVVAATPGQLIVGSDATSTSTLGIVIANSSTTGAGGSADTIVAGSETTNIYDSVGGATIFAGSGNLNFIGQTPTGTNYVTDTIVSSTGTTAIFGNSGDNVTFSSSASDPAVLVSAGTGNETLNGANATGGVYFFASQDSSSSAAIMDTVVGGSGSNYFQTGAGNEAYVAGSGTNIFDVATDLGPNTHITIYDFASGNDYADFVGAANYTTTVGSIDSHGTSTPTLTVTFADKSSVEFVGISSIPQGHII